MWCCVVHGVLSALQRCPRGQELTRWHNVLGILCWRVWNSGSSSFSGLRPTSRSRPLTRGVLWERSGVRAGRSQR